MTRGRRNGAARRAIPTPIPRVCAAASGHSVMAAFARLGPINDMTDVLYNAASNDAASLLASEQLMHLLDGWKYASAAFSAYLANSRSAATHFAYYAELRAAMSLFAGSGIRINQDDSYYLDSTGNRNAIIGDTRTHSITWAVWQEWIKRQDAIELLTHHVRLISGVSLKDFAGSGNLMSFALQHWGYDLLSLANDRGARNKASYIPTISSPLHQMLDLEANLIKRIWSLLLPTEHGVGFDTALINFLITKTARAYHQADPNKSIDEHVALIIDGASTQTGVDARLIRSLLVDSQPDIELFEKAANQSNDVGNVLCRALFLLRMASLSVENAMSANGPDPAAKWLRNWLSSGGLYEEQEIDPRDLSEDYRVAQGEYFIGTSSLPHCLWSPSEPNLPSSARLVRPDAFMAWAIAL